MKKIILVILFVIGLIGTHWEGNTKDPKIENNQTPCNYLLD